MQNHYLDQWQLLVQVSGIWLFFNISSKLSCENNFLIFLAYGKFCYIFINYPKHSGLAAAYRLKKEGVAVTLFEAESSSGGKIKSFCDDGFIWEKGPNTMVRKITHRKLYSLFTSLTSVFCNYR